MTRTKQGKKNRAKIYFDQDCTFVPNVGEVVLTYSEVASEYHLFTEAEWDACRSFGAGARLTANIDGNIFDNGKPTKKRLTKRMMRDAF